MSEKLYESVGILRYSTEPSNLRVVVDPAIADYYRALIPKYIRTNRQMYPAHVSVVRKEIIPNVDFWGKYEGEEVLFYYSNTVNSGQVYYWINVFCKRLEEIRLELGLPVSSPYTLPPEGFHKCFHCTIGNAKEL